MRCSLDVISEEESQKEIFTADILDPGFLAGFSGLISLVLLF